MAQFVDDFNRATLGANWTALDGTWTINASTEVQQTGGATFPAHANYATQVESEDHSSQIKWTYATGSNYFIGPSVRMANDDSQNGYFGFVRAGSGLRAIYKNVGSTATSLVSDSSGSGAPQVVKLEVVGNDLELFDDGVSALTVTDLTFSGSAQRKVGLVGHRSGTARGDDFLAEYTATAQDPIKIGIRRVEMTQNWHR